MEQNIYHTLEFDDDAANSRANEMLGKGWSLLHVGTKLVSYENGQAYYNTCYVVGGTKEQYDLDNKNKVDHDELFRKPD